MTHHDAPIDRDRVEILDICGRWSVFESQDPIMAGLVSELFANRPGTEWVIWKRPSKKRGYVAKATFGREPDCPDCCASGCPDDLQAVDRLLRMNKAEVRQLEQRHFELDKAVRDRLWPASQ